VRPSPGIVINGAVSQYDRRLRALDPGYAEVDGRPSQQLLNFSVEYGALINFYDEKDEIDGDWVNFFLTDPLMTLASIETMDLPEAEADFARLKEMTLAEHNSSEKFELLRAAFRSVLGLALDVNNWLNCVEMERGSETARLLRKQLVLDIEGGLNDQLRRLKAYDEGAATALGSTIGLDYSSFLPIWNLSGVCPDPSIYKGRRYNRKIDHAVPYLDPIFFAFVYSIEQLKLFAASNFTSAMYTGTHKPQIGLYIAFSCLFKHAQQTINTMSNRYVDFYYRDILRERHRGAIPDSVYLTFTLSDEEGVLSTTVPGGTLFPAGQDLNGGTVLYAADKSLVVTAAQIERLQTLRVLSGRLFAGEGRPPHFSYVETEPPQRVVRRVLASAITTAGENTDASESAQTPWATFGKDKVGTTDSETTEPASLGFGVASRYLMLTGGRRTVDLRIVYTRDFQDSVLNPLLATIADATGLSSTDAFIRLLDQSFTLYVSTQAGWLKIDAYRSSLPPSGVLDEPSFLLRFNLPPTAPAVVNFDPASEEEIDEAAAALVSVDPVVNASNPSPLLPTLKAYLHQEPARLKGPVGEVSVYPLSLLNEMPVVAFDIGVAVKELSDLQLSNTDGEIDAASPFNVLGGLPVVGSYLSIQQPELFVKKLDSLQIQIVWFNLPQNSTGFKGYYRYYDIGLDGQPDPNLFDNQVFRGSIRVSNPGSWVIDDSLFGFASPPMAADVYLFRSEPRCSDQEPARAGPLCAATGFDTLDIMSSAPPQYYDPAAGAIKLELTQPPYAFGNSIYSQNVLNAVIDDLPDTERCQEKCLARCEPLKRAMDCIQLCIDCLDGCDDILGLDVLDDFADASPPIGCVDKCLMSCVACLLEILIDCMKPMVAAGVVDGASISRVEAALRACIGLPEDQMARCIQRSLDECLLLAVDSPPRLPRKCTLILDAIFCLTQCAVECADDVPCLQGCLAKCIEKLSNEYDACLTACMDACLNPKKELRYPNEPYLPQATSLTVNYSARFSAPVSGIADSGSMFHLLPFGGYGPLQNEAIGKPTLLPVFSNSGNLYVGFTGLVPPQNLTLLFQMSCSPDWRGPAKLPPVQWDFLSGNAWKQLDEPRILADWTNGLQNTGIITLSLPTYDAEGHTVMPSSNQWLRASVPEKPDQFPKTMAVYAQASIATWVKDSSTGDHLEKPLPPYTISSSVEPLPDIETITQPIESFGGRNRETDATFNIRVGERLRHKDRGILGWDYERLVLERFPSIWKVIALPARDLESGSSPGAVLVVVVPGPDNIETVDPAIPAASSEMLYQIQSYLNGLMSSFIALNVVNPVYVRVTVLTSVQFREDEDPGNSINRLNEDLIQYLSPWFYDTERAAKGGQYASEDNISEFIQTRPYVEVMNDIGFAYEPDPDRLQWYFLTSAAKHVISVQVSEATNARR